MGIKKDETVVVFSGEAGKVLEELAKELSANPTSIVAEALDYYRTISQQYKLGKKCCFREGKILYELPYHGILGRYGEKWYQKKMGEKLN